MASTEKTNIYAFKAEAIMPQYSVVKAGATDGYVAQGDGVASTFGLLMNEVTAIDDLCEVSVSDGGKLKLAGAVAFGDELTSDGAGLGVVGAGGMIALSSGVAGDIIGVRIK